MVKLQLFKVKNGFCRLEKSLAFRPPPRNEERGHTPHGSDLPPSDRKFKELNHGVILITGRRRASNSGHA